MNKDLLRLCLVTDSRLCGERQLQDIVREAVAGGCTMVQLREKDIDTRTFLTRAREIKKVLAGSGVPLIINDRIDIAMAIQADGVHLGQSDMPIPEARALLGTDKIIGWSVESIEEVEIANAQDIDYIGISPVFATPTKTDTARPFGLEGTAEAVRRSSHPTIGIGGIHRHNIHEVLACGLDGVAVVSEIMTSATPYAAAHQLRYL